MPHHLDAAQKANAETESRFERPMAVLLRYNDNIAKPEKALLGLALLIVIALTVYGIKAVRHSDLFQSYAAPPLIQHAMHYAPHEDNALE